jgi:N-(5-amino-5-carboxypentanoyl)-L-cysteinyl-D-valine synthase
VSIFAIWKTGACYIPLDPAYPTERVRFIIEETQPKLIISTGLEVLRVASLTNGTPCVDISSENLIAHQPKENLDAKARARQ